jgi:hypothetical protein
LAVNRTLGAAQLVDPSDEPNVRGHRLPGALVQTNLEPDVLSDFERSRAKRERRGMAKNIVPIDAQKPEPALAIPVLYFADFHLMSPWEGR